MLSTLTACEVGIRCLHVEPRPWEPSSNGGKRSRNSASWTDMIRRPQKMDAYHKSGDGSPDLVYDRGRLEVGPATGRLRCHLCGLWFISLCQHARQKHRVSAPEYRVLDGLNRTTRLMAAPPHQPCRFPSRHLSPQRPFRSVPPPSAARLAGCPGGQAADR